MDGAKARLRDAMRARLDTVTPEVAREAGEAVAAHVVASAAWKGMRRLVAYSARADELPTSTLVEAAAAVGRPVAWPRIEWASQRPGTSRQPWWS